MNFRKRLKKRSRTTLREKQVELYVKVKNGYEVNPLFTKTWLFVSNKDVLKISENLFRGYTFLVKEKEYRILSI